MNKDKEIGNVSLPYSVIAKLHALKVKIGLESGKAPTIRSLALEAIKKYLEAQK
jgi:hypothetical protein